MHAEPQAMLPKLNFNQRQKLQNYILQNITA